MTPDIEKMKKVIDYEFNDKALLRRSLTHRSYSAENNLPYDNQRLEFLGDAVLEIILSTYLFKRYPEEQEGNMTKMRAAMVQQDALAKLARKIELGTFFIIGKGELETGGRERDSSLADLFESLTGAFYLDAGLERTTQFVIPLMEEVFPDPINLISELNPKGDLQEYAQRKWNCQPLYSTLETSGPDHNPCFKVNVLLSVPKINATGEAGNRKQAESEAARKALQIISKNI
jgi:ribonuclease III